ncbi:MAG: allophanate hydrolase [Granulosicoccus sp.]
MNIAHDMTLDGIRKQYAAGVTPMQLMQALRKRALEHSEHNIFIHLLSDDELAPWIDALMTMDKDCTALWGVPFVLKDNIDLADIPTTAACEAFTFTPSSTAFVAQQFIDQGALPLGKANLDQFATGLNGTRSPWGPCRNSFDKRLVSGGSSAGSAVAVGLGLASFSLGTDTAGSGRVPASFNNLVGVKPTRGLLSTSGVVPACKSLDCVSIFALHCDDANEILAIAEGYDPSDAYSRENSYSNKSANYGHFDGALTLGVLPSDQLRFFGDKDYESAYLSSIETLKSQGIKCVEVDYAPFDEVARLLYEGPWVAERYIATLPLIEEQPEAIFPAVRDIVAPGGKPTAAELFRAQYRLNELMKPCNDQLAQLDALLTPTAGRLFTIEEMLEEPIKRNSELGYYMNFVNLLDLAAIAVPTAFTAKGLPFGVTLSAPAFSDRRLLSIANRFQKIFELSIGTSTQTVPPLTKKPAQRTDWMELVVCGAHLEGMPLNNQLTDRGSYLLEKTTTSTDYQLFALHEEPIERPALVRSIDDGVAIEVEVWNFPSSELGSFLAGIASPLGLGNVSLADGRSATGFIAEACAIEMASDVTSFGGWRAYLKSKS